ncbi:MAG TPA: lipopolysaccharide biosynthesis protein [Vicinamibacterales bacterium]
MSIERKAISALKWATGAKLVVQVASWAGTLVVVRLLAPEAYGLMAKVGVVCTVAGAIADLGLEAAIVRSSELVRDDVRKLFSLSLLFGVGMTALVVALSPLLARVFHEPRLTWPIAAASLQFVIGAIAVVPSALWARDLSFRNLAKVEVVSGISTTIATLLLAMSGADVWALVLGTLFGALVRSSTLLALGEREWPLLSFRGVAEHLKFGLTVASGRVSYFILVQSDVLIGSAFLSTTEIGQYSMALQLATLPMAKIMGTINQITLPAMARQQNDPSRVRHSVLKSVGLMSLVAFPALCGISAVAPELVRVLFGTRWLQAIPALMILPLIVPIRMICGVLFTTSLALGNRTLDLRNTVVNFVLLPTGFFIGAHWGLVGLCSAWLVSVPVAYACNVPALLRFIHLSARDLAAECAPPMLASAVMYGAVFGLRTGLVGQSPIVALNALIVGGAVVYCAVMALISPRHLASILGFARSMVARGTPETA